MKNIGAKHKAMRQFFEILYNELKHILRDEGVMLILIFAPLIYATIYSLTYGTQVLRNIPIGVIDNDHTPSSRKLIDILSMGANAYVAFKPTDIHDAEKLFFDRKIYGIAYIPQGYERNLIGGNEATVAIYLDASYMLMYRQVFQDMVAGITTTGAMVEFQRMIAQGAQTPQAKDIVQPVRYASHTLFNPYLGYGSFVMPPVLILILQQTLLIGIGMIGGTLREKRLYPTTSTSKEILRIIAGKTSCYFIIYVTLSLYLLCIHYRIFHYPMNGDMISIVIFIGIYLLACIFLGIALSTLFRRRETPLMLLLWTSIPLLMLSGVSYPSGAIPEWLQWIAKIFPSTYGTRGFIKLQTMGASLNEVLTEIVALCIMIPIYFLLAYIGLSHIIRNKNSQ